MCESPIEFQAKEKMAPLMLKLTGTALCDSTKGRTGGDFKSARRFNMLGKR